jgi:hypothetical protein
MNNYRFRAITPDGSTVFEATRPAKNIGEAIAVGLRTADEVKSRQPLDPAYDRWFIDIQDSSGCWLTSVPVVMDSREASTNDLWQRASPASRARHAPGAR